MLFVEENLHPYKGVYYKDESIIERYTKLFDEVWNFEAVTHNNPKVAVNSGTTSNVGFTPNQFFEDLSNINT